MIGRFMLVAAVGVWVAAAAAQTTKYEPRRAAAMHDDLRAVNVIQSAVARGDLAAAAGPARQLAALAVPPGLPDGATKHVLSINAAAREVLDANNATVAATATARLLAACGNCHRAVGTMPAMADSRLPSVGGTVGHMLEHQRSVDHMLRGLVIPSDREWLEGARQLRAAPLHARALPRDARLMPELLRVEEAVHGMAEEALAAQTSDTRIRAYSTVLARCADCHSLHRKIWGPPQ